MRNSISYTPEKPRKHHDFEEKRNSKAKVDEQSMAYVCNGCYSSEFFRRSLVKAKDPPSFDRYYDGGAPLCFLWFLALGA